MQECNWGKVPDCCDWCEKNGQIECIALKIPNIDKVIKALKNEKEEIRKLSQVKSEFLANISHEIKTPMNAILGMSYLLSKTNISPEQKNYTDKIISSAKTLLGIMNDILDMSKIEAGKMQVNLGLIQIRKLIDDVISIVRFAVEEKNLRFLVYMHPLISENLHGDEIRIKQILLNLINNAVKFTDKGEIIVSVNLNTDGYIIFSVKDSGIGIKECERSEIFKPFIQVDSSVRKRYQGSGLGLSICKNLVDLMGGELWFESEYQKGSEFCFSIPLKQYSTNDNSQPPLVNVSTDHQYYWIEENPIVYKYLSNWISLTSLKIKLCKSLTEFAFQLDDQPSFLFLTRTYLMNAPDNYFLVDLKKNMKLGKVNICMLTHFSEKFELDRDWMSIVDYHFTLPLQTWLIERILNELTSGTEIEFLGSLNQKFKDEEQKLDNIRVLIVEDNIVNQMVAHDILVKMGATVTLAEGGEAALCLIDSEQKNFDIILMDIQMPLMDGYQATQKIKSIKTARNIPIIAMTAHSKEDERENYLNSGMIDFIAKPFEPEQLVKILLKYCRPQLDNFQDLYQNQSEIFLGEGIDWCLAKQNMGNNESLLNTVLSRFRSDYSTAKNFLTQSYLKGDMTHFERNIYSLKAISCYIGANSLRKKSDQLEKLFKDRDKDHDQQNLIKAIMDTEIEVGFVLTEVDQYLKKATSAISFEFN
jgi:CheY-like chemotaxis protein/nitrogen-specific signal transduction histidine kinase